MVFIPTYLYIKQHTITGKLYFGKSTRKENRMLSYRGSGKYWKSHINKHGKEHVITLWHQLYDNPFDLVADALSMSKSFDIVGNESWLNLIVENGLDGGGCGEDSPLFGLRGTQHPAYNKGESHHLFGKCGELHPLFGRKCPEISKRMSGEGNPNYKKLPSEDTKNLWRNAVTLRYDIQLPSGEILIGLSAKEISAMFSVTSESVIRRFKSNKLCRNIKCLKSYRFKNK